MTLVDGEYRDFQNYYINGKKYTFGLPKSNCRNKMVWVGFESKFIEYISVSEFKNRIDNNSFTNKIKNTRSIDAIKKQGYCKICNKKLRGNINKPLCFKCYNAL